MSTILALRFPTGRYHATAWGRSANEAVPEWPPSPWRLLRALYATWQCRCPDLPEEDVVGLLQFLAVPPAFRLPRRAEAHTRHYMPDPTHMRDRRKTGPVNAYSRDARDLVFDPFVALDPSATVLLSWRGNPPAGQAAALMALCAALPYLGRAESLCEARVVFGDESEPEELGAGSDWFAPAAVSGQTHPLTDVLAPQLPLDLSALVVSPQMTKARRLAVPAGSRWVPYPVPPAERDERLRPRRGRRPPPRVEAVRFRLDGPTLPPWTEVVTYASVLRDAAQSRRGRTGTSATLSGRRGRGDAWRRDDHRHAHYLLLEDRREGAAPDQGRGAVRGVHGPLGTALVWAPEGFDEDDVDALMAIRRMWASQVVDVFAPGFRKLRVGVEAVGPVRQVAPELCGPARTWRSATPYLTIRHQGRRPTESFLSDEIRRELQLRLASQATGTGLASGAGPGAEDLVAVAAAFGDGGGEPPRPLPVPVRRRRPRPERPSGQTRTPYELRLEFRRPVTGPIAIGALSHFGMGLFVPDQ